MKLALGNLCLYTIIKVCATINDLSRTIEVTGRFIDLGVLREKSFDDCQYIASALTSECDAIVSWTFKHIVNHKTIMGVKAVTALEGYSDILIYTPLIHIGGETNDT